MRRGAGGDRRARTSRACRSSSTRCGSSRSSGSCRRRTTPGSGSSRACRWPPACSPGDTTRRRRSPTTTAPTTATARRSTWARRSPACRTTSASRPCAALSAAVPEGATTAQFALRWILDQPGVTTVIPGARNREQVLGNVAAAALAPLTPDALATVRVGLRRLRARRGPRPLVTPAGRGVRPRLRTKGRRPGGRRPFVERAVRQSSTGAGAGSLSLAVSSWTSRASGRRRASCSRKW